MLQHKAHIRPRHGKAAHHIEAGGIFAAAERRNLRRAGILPNRLSTRMRVPGGRAAGASSTTSP
jgi:hypothetical protein